MSEVTQKFLLSKRNDKEHLFPCTTCSNATSHHIISSYVLKWWQGSGAHEMEGNVSYQTIQCLGCKSVSFRKVSTDTEDYYWDEQNNHHSNETITYYPYRSTTLRQIDEHLLPRKIQQIYSETKEAIDIEQNILAGIGVRALIETVCGDLKAAGRNLKDQIDWLHKQSLITKEGMDTLHKLRVLGNKAAHEVKAHTKPQLLLALEIIEHMLEGTYIIPKKVSKTLMQSSETDEI